MMYGQNVFVACSAIILALFLGKGYAIQCYSCTASSNTPSNGCATGALSSTSKVSCPAGRRYCLTTTIYTTGLGISTVSTVRGCSAVPNSGTLCSNIGGMTSRAYYSTCSTDNCNIGTIPNRGCSSSSGTGEDTTSSAVKIAGGYSFIALSMLAALLAVQNLM
uniref:uncharacterized protein LOC108949986 n=1 Tax=Ciona intestinalis TaxID=7719 RepID=UPI00089DB9BA|nr:uncharacterized protein LOC108949986 [Ciona intestinalis]XP_026692940.1 uncharacterized protein LOC108949986 [Ciona intestinalis]|eukprot:XP_018669864.1 uncharacterized protein LOC108949986 [Ciona intestinalis]